MSSVISSLNPHSYFLTPKSKLGIICDEYFKVEFGVPEHPPVRDPDGQRLVPARTLKFGSNVVATSVDIAAHKAWDSFVYDETARDAVDDFTRSHLVEFNRGARYSFKLWVPLGIFLYPWEWRDYITVSHDPENKLGDLDKYVPFAHDDYVPGVCSGNEHRYCATRLILGRDSGYGAVFCEHACACQVYRESERLRTFLHRARLYPSEIVGDPASFPQHRKCSVCCTSSAEGLRGIPTTILGTLMSSLKC